MLFWMDADVVYGPNRRIKVGTFENKVLRRMFFQLMKEEVMEERGTLQDK
jgi:hypothetical protein